MDNEVRAGSIRAMDRDIGPPWPREAADERDNVVVLRNVSWAQYQALAEAREKFRPKLTYLDGVLEVMTKGALHERSKTFIARLVEMYAVECDVELIGLGETTWQRKAKKAGVEADECYFLDKMSEYPDLAIEVVIASGGVDKLEIYRRLGVREVWFWIDERLWLYALENAAYRPIRKSRVVRDIDLAEIARIVRTTKIEHQTRAVRAYRDTLRKR